MQGRTQSSTYRERDYLDLSATRFQLGLCLSIDLNLIFGRESIVNRKDQLDVTFMNRKTIELTEDRTQSSTY